jgi:hypothetical protein
MFLFKPTRKQLRKMKYGNRTNRNKNTYMGIPKQIVKLSDGSHKVIIHRKSKMFN